VRVNRRPRPLGPARRGGRSAERCPMLREPTERRIRARNHGAGDVPECAAPARPTPVTEAPVGDSSRSRRDRRLRKLVVVHPRHRTGVLGRHRIGRPRLSLRRLLEERLDYLGVAQLLEALNRGVEVSLDLGVPGSDRVIDGATRDEVGQSNGESRTSFRQYRILVAPIENNLKGGEDAR